MFAILKQEPGQQIPRPWRRVGSEPEIWDALLRWWQQNTSGLPGPIVATRAINTDTAVLHHRGTRFYAFVEPEGER
jgi:hypothetical protein